MNFTEEIIKHIEDTLVARYESGALMSEADYIAGAITAVHAVVGNQSMEDVPPSWIWLPIGSRSIVANIYNKRGKENRAKLVEKEIEETYRTRMHAKDMLYLLKNVANVGEDKKVSDVVRDELDYMGFDWRPAWLIDDVHK